MVFSSLAVAITAAMLSYHGPMDFNCTATPLEVSWPGALKLVLLQPSPIHQHFSNQQVGVVQRLLQHHIHECIPCIPGFMTI